MKLANKKFAPTIKTSGLSSGDVVGDFFYGEMHYYIYDGYDETTGDNVFTNLCTGRVFKNNTEKEYFYFPNACFNPLGE